MNISISERFFAILMYTLPLRYCLGFGDYLFIDFPIMNYMRYLTLPIALIEKNLPIGTFFIFFLLFIGIVRNPRISYFLRFNTLQALLVNIILIISSYSLIIISQFLDMLFIVRTFSNCIFLSMSTIIIFCLIKCFQGEEADIPIISNATRLQI